MASRKIGAATKRASSNSALVKQDEFADCASAGEHDIEAAAANAINARVAMTSCSTFYDGRLSKASA
jgi:hypothetical protein